MVTVLTMHDLDSNESSSDPECELSPALRSLGVSVKTDDNGKRQFIVDFEEHGDPFNPQAWGVSRKWITTGIVGCTGLLVGWASAVDSTVVPAIRRDYTTSPKTKMEVTFCSCSEM